MVLANGQHMFSCGANQGVFSMNIPLDGNGQYKLQVYADGRLPNVDRHDRFQLDNDVVMGQPPAHSCEPDDRVNTNGSTFGNVIPTLERGLSPREFQYFSGDNWIIVDLDKTAWVDGMIALAPATGSRLTAQFEVSLSSDYVFGDPATTGTWTQVAADFITAGTVDQQFDFSIPNQAQFIKVVYPGFTPTAVGEIWDYFHSISYLESLPAS
jgi:hypothetical protein